MRFAFVASACFLIGTALFLACSDDTGGTSTSSSSTSSTGGSTSSSSSGQSQGDDDEGEVDSGIKVAPFGCKGDECCILHNTEYQKATVAQSLPRDGVAQGGVAWATPEGAVSEDGSFATVTLLDGEESAFLALNDYKFELPNDKATYGITVQLKRQSADGGVEDATIQVILDTTATPRTKIYKEVWPRQIVGTHHYGQEIDTWGTDLSPSHINKTTFGTRIAAKRKEGITGPVLARVDSLKIRISYCNADKL